MREIVLSRYRSHENFKGEVCTLTGVEEYKNLEIKDLISKLVGNYSLALDDGIFILRILYRNYLVFYNEDGICIFECKRDSSEILNLTIGVCRLSSVSMVSTKLNIFKSVLDLSCRIDNDGIRGVLGEVKTYVSMCADSAHADIFDKLLSNLLDNESVQECVRELEFTLSASIYNLLLRLLLNSIFDNSLCDFIDDVKCLIVCFKFDQDVTLEKSILLELELKYREKLVFCDIDKVLVTEE